MFVEQWTSDEARGRIALFTKGSGGKIAVATGQLYEDDEVGAGLESPLDASITIFPNGRSLVRLDMDGSRSGVGFGNSWKASYFLMKRGMTLRVIFGIGTGWSSNYVEGYSSDEECWDGEEGRSTLEFLGTTTNGWPDIQRVDTIEPTGTCPSGPSTPAPLKRRLFRWDGLRYRELLPACASDRGVTTTPHSSTNPPNQRAAEAALT